MDLPNPTALLPPCLRRLSAFAGAWTARSSPCPRDAITATLLALSAAATPAHADTLFQDTTFTAKGIERRNAELFHVPIPGETYDELSGAVGHRVTDMTLKGNGLLSFGLIRKFEEVPSAYPYALGTMSLDVPTLTIESRYIDNAGPHPTNFHCDSWTAEKTANIQTAHHVYNAMPFKHEGGSTLLQSRDLATPEFRALFPADALYLSPDYYYLSCEGERFVIHAPDGVEYVFDASGTERTTNTRIRGSYDNPKLQLYRKYTLRVVEKRRLTARLRYTYEAMPHFIYNDDGTTAPHPVNAPLRSPNSEYWRASRYVAHFAPYIHRKVRLRSVALKVTGESDRVVNFKYRPEHRGATCPGLLEKAYSSHTAQDEVKYSYLPYTSLATNGSRPVGMPPSGCVLHKVTRGDGSTWQFDYGLVAAPKFSVDGVDERYPASSTLVQYAGQKTGGKSRGDFYAYLPLRSVKIPTGATVTYDYMDVHPGREVTLGGLGLCEYQDIARVSDTTLRWYGVYTGPEDCRREGSKVAPRRPAIIARTVSGAGIITAKATIAYKRNLPADTPSGVPSYTVERWIQDGSRTTRLVFYRTDRVVQPDLNVSQLQNGGRLKRLEIYRGIQTPHSPPPPDNALVSVDYTYTEKNNSFIKRGTWYNFSKDSGVLWWREANNRSTYVYDMRQVSLAKKVIHMDGLTMTTEYQSFDAYNNPTRIIESQSGPDARSRTTLLGYDNNYSSKNVWFVKAPTSKQVYAGLLKYSYSTTFYNSNGLPRERIEDGRRIYYGYHGHGQLFYQGTGGTYTYYRDYVNGVPTIEYTGYTFRSTPTTRDVDDAGNVVQLTDPEGRITSYKYRSSDSVLVEVKPPAPLGTTTIQPPIWQGSWPRYSSEAGPEKTTTTYFDALGRETARRESADGTVVARTTKYDREGRIVFQGDPAPNFTASNEVGVHLGYDALDRVVLRRQTREPSGIRICYGPPCNDDPDFSGAGNVAFGHAVRDQNGYVSAYNFRSLGSPANRVLMSIRREVRRSGETAHWGDSRPRVVQTTISRNLLGFVERVSQGSGGGAVVRWYTPYRHFYGGSEYVTSMLGAETHPEFGTRTVLERDSAGRAKRIREYDGSEYTYVYDQRGNIRSTEQTTRGSSDLQPVEPIDYAYHPSGSLESIAQGDARWAYEYDGAGLLHRESLALSGEFDHDFALTYDRDGAGHVTRITYPSGRTIDRDVDGFGRVRSVTGFVSDAVYHADGQLDRLTYENGVEQSVSLDGQRRPRRRVVIGTRATLLDQTTDYDARGNVAGISGYFLPGGNHLYGLAYDGLSQLHTASGVWGTSRYVYDELGNLRYMSGSGQSYSYDDDNRLSSTLSGANRAQQVRYDGMGNIREYGHRTFTFDGMNRLLQSVKHDRDDEEAPFDIAFSQNNVYDAYGLRVATRTAQTVEERRNGRDVSRTHEATTFYVYNRAGELMHEHDFRKRVDPLTREAVYEGLETRDHVRLGGRTIAVVGRHRNHDTDGDGMPDHFERRYGLSTLLTSDASGDKDGDGRTNLEEFLAGSSPLSSDTDHDGVLDVDDPDHALPGGTPGGSTVVLEPIFTFLEGD